MIIRMHGATETVHAHMVEKKHYSLARRRHSCHIAALGSLVVPPLGLLRCRRVSDAWMDDPGWMHATAA